MAYQLIMVAPNMEASVSRVLTSLDFEHWIFRVRRRVVYRGHLAERTQPLFPGYVFVFARNAWVTIKHIIGVRDFVRFGGQLQDVPQRVVEDLRAQCDDKGVLLRASAEPLGFQPGDRISVTLSPGVTLQGSFLHLLTPERAIILLDRMGRMSVGVAECKPVVFSEKPARRRPRRR